jgi:glucan phosphoethanolaminetransferase (alkaline phosphatase superfamily)
MPDMLYVEAVGEMYKTQLGLGKHSLMQRPGLRHSKDVPRLDAQPARQRNVVLVVLESVRNDATCSAFDPTCQTTPYTNALFPERIALPQLRALDSCTIVSMGVLYAGIAPNASRQDLHEWPLLFDYAHAAGYTTALLTSQNLMFGNMALWLKHLKVDHLLSGLDVDPEAHVDLGAEEQAFTARAIPIVRELKAPYFLVIQLSNGHYPYLVDARGPAPFQPSTTSKAPKDNARFFNHYKNAVHQQDQHLARLLKEVRAAPGGERTVVVYTSDHGEAFREHDQMGHTFSLYDEELRVPGFIDAPWGTLTQEEERALRDNARHFLTHPDLTATIVDLLGLWRLSDMRPFRSKMLGRSLLSDLDEAVVFPLTNCAEIWSCAFENWGVLQGNFKLQAREWDSDYRCFDLSQDPQEQHDLGQGSCGHLRQAAARWFPRLPGRNR